jgi:hypothetical protein
VRLCPDAGTRYSFHAEAEQLCNQNLELLICYCNSPCYFHICSAAFAERASTRCSGLVVLTLSVLPGHRVLEVCDLNSAHRKNTPIAFDFAAREFLVGAGFPCGACGSGSLLVSRASFGAGFFRSV